MSEKLAWGILATGAIARTFAKGLANSKTGRLVAVGSRSKEKAEKFGDEFAVPRRFGSYEELLASSEVQAVYVATPHPSHALWAIRAAEAGKHLLVEKPIGLNHAEAMAIVEAAIANDVFLMEAFMYRCHPQTAKLVELVREKTIGQVRVITATFSFHWPRPWNAESRLISQETGGGGILDVGCYTTSISRLIAGAAMGKDFADPIEVKGAGHLGQSGVDEWACATLKFPGDIIAQLSTGVQVNQENSVKIYGSDGSIHVPGPWIPTKEGGSTKIIIQKHGEKEPHEITIETKDWLYALEADTVAMNLARRQAPAPAMSWADTLGNMKTLDAWRGQLGFAYNVEKAEKYPKTTVAGRTLAVSRNHNMKYGKIDGVEKTVSRLVLGCDNQGGLPHAAVMMDDFFERGGNAFDTAYIYGGGSNERLLGQWIKHRGVRDQVVILSKGGHTPFCTPEHVTNQFKESLERMQTDYADIYMMHRDNPTVPVGEFIDMLNEHVDAGRMKAFGGSNWSPTRVQEANDYARSKGLRGFGAMSNNFSLARMVQPVWAGCIAASDAESRAWLTRTQLPLMAWSSQARGFFLPGRAAPDKTDDAEMVPCWYSDDNFKRLERAKELAEKKGVSAINIALAYVLCQPFPTFALVGPRQLSETRTSLPALDVELSAGELRWLNLED